jgi:DNA-directed RNA polymerase subunit RPC12/RpoP
LDEFEAIKLVNYQGLDQQEASEEMGVSRPTITRLISSANKKIAEFLIEGRELVIEGGNIHFKENFYECLDCGHRFKINIETEILECPSCKSKKLLDFAGRFGHGHCCRRRNGKNQED